MTTTTSFDIRLPVIEIKDEVELVYYYTQNINQAGFNSDISSIVNFYVSLKSRPLVILSGPKDSPKEILIQCLARLLFGQDCYQCQTLAGHPWWAEETTNTPFFVQIQNSFNSQKIYYLLKEALQPKNVERVFLTSLVHLSPAELNRFFTEVAYQVQHQEIVRFGNMHLPEPVPFPPNLFLVGTMDVLRFNEWSQDLLSGATIIQWTEQYQSLSACPLSNDNVLYSGEKIFLNSCFRNINAAYGHLHKVLGPRQQAPFEPLFDIKSLIERHYVMLPPRVTSDVILYMANAWSIDGDGLFESCSSRNFEIALAYAIAQLLLPWIMLDDRKSTALFKALSEYCFARFPISYQQVLRLIEC